MSKDAVLKFRDAINGDPAIQSEMSSAPGQQGFNLVAFASEHGFEFTPDELSEVAASVDQLTDFELEIVAGGGDVMGSLFGVFKESIGETNEDKRDMLSRLKEMNDLADDYAEQLKAQGPPPGDSGGSCGG